MAMHHITSEAEPAKLLRGTVKALKRVEGYGFITHRATGHDYFFHRSAVDPNGEYGFEDLEVDQLVEFRPVEAPKGLRAIEIRPVSRRMMDLFVGIAEGASGDIAVIATQNVGQNMVGADRVTRAEIETASAIDAEAKKRGLLPPPVLPGIEPAIPRPRPKLSVEPGANGGTPDDAPLTPSRCARRLMPGTKSLFRGKVRKPVSLTLTPEHHAKITRNLLRLELTSRADFLGLLVEKYADVVTV
jgi:cold shock CspA family protein